MVIEVKDLFTEVKGMVIEIKDLFTEVKDTVIEVKFSIIVADAYLGFISDQAKKHCP